jgi:hypothetical protein
MGSKLKDGWDALAYELETRMANTPLTERSTMLTFENKEEQEWFTEWWSKRGMAEFQMWVAANKLDDSNR